MLIQTERLYLRKFVEDDLQHLFPILSDAETMVYYPSPFSRDKVEKWIGRSIQSYETEGYGLWAVILKDSDEFIGDCGITLQEIDGEALPEVGYHICKKHWNKGYATEAARGVINYGFSTLNLQKLFTYTTVENVPSQRVALKNGMKFVKKFYKQIMGTTVEEVLYSMSSKDFTL
jgi:RimJ/RimL family protein N-acetyltransferase